jgi:TatD DNase family protein
MIAMGVDAATSRGALELAHGHPGVWAAVGHHPTEASEPDYQALRSLAMDPERGGAGQIERLDALFAMAVDLNLPVSIHNRGATADIERLIATHAGLRGVMHYFTLGWDDATRFLDLGFYLSFAGVITRPSRQELREVVKRCPADRLLLETDSPYGNSQKRMGVQNRPAYLLDTAELVAELRGLSIDELGDLETANALALYQRMR